MRAAERERYRNNLKNREEPWPYLVTLAIILSFTIAPVLAHAPLLPQGNDELGTATFVSDPIKSWAIYSTLDEGGRAHYYRFTATQGQHIHITLSRSTSPDDREFVPGFVLMGPGIQGQGVLPRYVEVPEGSNASVVAGRQTDRAMYEPFSASSLVSVAELNTNAPASGAYYIAVYEASRGGRYILALGDRESFSMGEWFLIPITLLSIYRWEGQSIPVIFLPMALTAAVGLFVIWRRNGLRAKTPCRWAGILAGLLFLGSGASTFYQMLRTLTRTSPVPEMGITIFLALVSLVLSIAVIHMSMKNHNAFGFRQRAFLAALGVIALFAWAGLILGPILAVAASILPARTGIRS